VIIIFPVVISLLVHGCSVDFRIEFRIEFIPPQREIIQSRHHPPISYFSEPAVSHHALPVWHSASFDKFRRTSGRLGALLGLCTRDGTVGSLVSDRCGMTSDWGGNGEESTENRREGTGPGIPPPKKMKKDENLPIPSHTSGHHKQSSPHN